MVKKAKRKPAGEAPPTPPSEDSAASESDPGASDSSDSGVSFGSKSTTSSRASKAPAPVCTPRVAREPPGDETPEPVARCQKVEAIQSKEEATDSVLFADLFDGEIVDIDGLDAASAAGVEAEEAGQSAFLHCLLQSAFRACARGCHCLNCLPHDRRSL